ncbi:hypothetical protein LU298_17910 (plasmid) [Komagataeibacter intermedius]|uniref:hypothetical protein n=1 Tax=Komagataeibacter intermedius TaxID=66229 RepID=UPI001F2D8BF3|nr:hypothetical protein [Komagataeibacter intermedius]MCF3638331.1 hypothetical protein [Komagataeibacter intermedius]
MLRIVVVVDRPPDAPGTWYVIEDGYLTTRLACVARFGRLLAACRVGHFAADNAEADPAYAA